MVGWLAGCLAGWLVEWFAEWSADAIQMISLKMVSSDFLFNRIAFGRFLCCLLVHAIGFCIIISMQSIQQSFELDKAPIEPENRLHE